MIFFLRCKHTRVCCTHGDEIIYRNFRRRVCLDCNRALRGPLPYQCTRTGTPHSIWLDPVYNPDDT